MGEGGEKEEAGKWQAWQVALETGTSDAERRYTTIPQQSECPASETASKEEQPPREIITCLLFTPSPLLTHDAPSIIPPPKGPPPPPEVLDPRHQRQQGGSRLLHTTHTRAAAGAGAGVMRGGQVLASRQPSIHSSS